MCRMRFAVFAKNKNVKTDEKAKSLRKGTENIIFSVPLCVYITTKSGFFLYYDAQFAPQETIITMDYPTICPVRGKCGIDAIELYVKYISYEQKFMGAFQKQYVYEVLERDQADHKNGFDNICRVILRHVLGHLLIKKGFLEEAGKQDYEKVSDLVISSSGQRLREVLIGLLEKLIHETYDADKGMRDYLAFDLDDFVVEMQNAAEHDVMKQVIAL